MIQTVSDFDIRVCFGFRYSDFGFGLGRDWRKDTMTTALAHLFQDVLQVCRNGHVVTDRLRTCPDHSRHHCERCGTTTLHACLTCGWELPGAIVVPGLDPVGMREPPQFCATCGAPMPWHRRPAQ